MSNNISVMIVMFKTKKNGCHIFPTNVPPSYPLAFGLKRPFIATFKFLFDVYHVIYLYSENTILFIISWALSFLIFAACDYILLSAVSIILFCYLFTHC